MAAPKLAIPTREFLKNKRKALVVLITALGIVLLAGLATGMWFYRAGHAAQPQLDGRIEVSGLMARVTVTRDGHGVPTIVAASMEDLFFAQGYVTAQDRLWQMDMSRRFAGGEMAEVLGSDWVKHDVEQRTLSLRARAERGADELSPRDRSYMDAYAQGVNAFIKNHRNRLPLEFRALRYAPRAWTSADSLAIAANMVKELNHAAAAAALRREKVTEKIGAELASDLYTNVSWRDHPPGDGARGDVAAAAKAASSTALDGAAKSRTLSKQADRERWQNGAAKSGALSQLWPVQTTDPGQLQLGSNNWVISGAHTYSGKPLLSNDPHLGHQLPGVWYETHLRSGNFDVVGVSLPGVPAIILGHNQRIAWGFTNVEATVEDVFVEEFNASGQYRTPDGWRQPDHKREVIQVRGGSNVAVDVVITRHGPIISGLFPGEKRQLALQWTLYTPGALYSPFFDLDAAQNWAEVRKALSNWVAPGQNVDYADVDGHIGYQATGKFPIRAGDGSLPASGSDNMHEWTGFIPFEQLPSVFDPPSGILATANGRITPDGYPHSISVEWGAPYRTERIYKVLQAGKKFRPEDMLALQMDVHSEFDRFCAEHFVYALDHVKRLSEQARRARDMMRDWDGQMRADSAAAAIEVLAQRELFRMLLEAKLGPVPADDKNENATVSWKTYDWSMWPVWMENVLLHQPKRWLPPGYNNYDDLLATAVERVVGGSSAEDLASWRWGQISPVEIQHPLFGWIPILKRWTGPGLNEQSGHGSLTVKAAGLHFGASERSTEDLSNLDNSTLNIVLGQSGNLFSPYYLDQWPAWYEGKTFAVPFSAEAVQAARTHELVLEPAK